MREYDDLCLAPVKPITAKEVAKIRKAVNVSQNLFARYLNTSESTVQKWEVGAKKPSALVAARGYQFGAAYGEQEVPAGEEAF